MPMPAGEYYVVAVPAARRDAWRDPQFLEKLASVATRVTVGWGETKTQDLVLQTVESPR